MFSFIKSNSYLIVRLMLNQFGMMMFGLMVSMAAAAVDVALAGGSGEVGRTCMLWSSVFSILFYMFINYMALKEEGQKDAIRLSAGRIEYTPLRGLYIALCASALNILLGVVIIITGILGAESGLALAWAGGLCGSAKVIASIFQAMYWGLMLGVSGVTTIAELPAIWFLLIPIPTIVCGYVSYYFGLHDRGIFKAIKGFFTPEGSDKNTK